MDNHRWEEAAEAYRRKRAEQHPADQSGVVQPSVNTTAIAVAARELEQFLDGPDGIAGLSLLKASGMEIILYHEFMGMGMGSTYFLDYEGLKESQQPEGMYLAYVKEGQIPKSSVWPVSARVVVDTIVRQGAEPASILASIKDRLDRIAAEILDS